MSISLTGFSHRPNCAAACGALQHQSQPEVSLHQASASYAFGGISPFLWHQKMFMLFLQRHIWKYVVDNMMKPGVLFFLSTEQNGKLVFVNLHNWIQKMTEAMLPSWLSRCQIGRLGLQWLWRLLCHMPECTDEHHVSHWLPIQKVFYENQDEWNPKI